MFRVYVHPIAPNEYCFTLIGRKALFSSLIRGNRVSEDFSRQLLDFLKFEFKELKMQAKKPNPYNKREVKNDRKAFSRTDKSVKPVAKDTNKTRRRMIKPTARGR